MQSGDTSQPATYVTDRKRRTRPWRGVLVALVVLIALGSLAVWLRNGIGQVTLDLEDVKLGVLERAAFTPETIVNGSVVSETAIAVAALESGVIDTLHVQNGAQVSQGDPVATLSNPTLQKQVSDESVRLSRDIVSIEGQVTDMERRVVEAERLLRDVQFRLRQAESELSRNQVLEERGFASPASMDRLRDEVAYYSGEERAVLARLRTAEENARVRIARLNAIREDLERLSALGLRRLDNLILTAPTDGQVVGLQVRTGEPVQNGSVVFRVSRGTADQIVARVFESLAGQIQPGAQARLLGEEARLRVDIVAPEAENGGVGVRLAFETAAPSSLRAGQVVQLAIQSGVTREALLAPPGDLVGPEYLWIINASRTRARAVPVRLGQRSDKWVEVLSGLEPGETILVSAPRSLDNLSEIRLRSGR